MDCYDSYFYSVGIVSNKFRDTCTWFQTNTIQQISLGNYKNVYKILSRPLHISILWPTMIALIIIIGEEWVPITISNMAKDILVLPSFSMNAKMISEFLQIFTMFLEAIMSMMLSKSIFQEAMLEMLQIFSIKLEC